MAQAVQVAATRTVHPLRGIETEANKRFIVVDVIGDIGAGYHFESFAFVYRRYFCLALLIAYM